MVTHIENGWVAPHGWFAAQSPDGNEDVTSLLDVRHGSNRIGNKVGAARAVTRDVVELHSMDEAIG